MSMNEVCCYTNVYLYGMQRRKHKFSVPITCIISSSTCL